MGSGGSLGNSFGNRVGIISWKIVSGSSRGNLCWTARLGNAVRKKKTNSTRGVYIYIYVGETLCKILEGIEIVKLSWEALLVEFLGMRYWGYMLEHF